MPAPVTLGDEEIPQLLPKRVPRAREEREAGPNAAALVFQQFASDGTHMYPTGSFHFIYFSILN